MKFIENKKDVLLKSWSVWAFLAISALTGAELILSQFGPEGLGLSQKSYSLLVLVVSLLGPVLRILNQRVSEFIADEGGWMRKRTAGGFGAIAAIAVAASVPFVGGWEGLRTSAYRDIVGVVTVCYGETRGVKITDRYTQAECDAMLEEGLQDFADDLGRCLKVDVPQGVGVAFLSWSYNVGIGAACKSTLVRKANAGDLYGACDELLRWDRAGGRKVKGLTNRRVAERKLCRASLDAVGYRR